MAELPPFDGPYTKEPPGLDTLPPVQMVDADVATGLAAQVAELRRLLAQRDARIAELESNVAFLEANLSKVEQRPRPAPAGRAPAGWKLTPDQIRAFYAANPSAKSITYAAWVAWSAQA